MKIGRFFVGRDGYGRFCVRWPARPAYINGTLTFKYRSIPREPRQYGQTVRIEPDALTERAVFNAVNALINNAIDTHLLLRKGLRLNTLRLFYVEPDRGHPETLISWKAVGR